MDIKHHQNEPIKAISAVRNWFSETVRVKKQQQHKKYGPNFVF